MKQIEDMSFGDCLQAWDNHPHDSHLRGLIETQAAKVMRIMPDWRLEELAKQSDDDLRNRAARLALTMTP